MSCLESSQRYPPSKTDHSFADSENSDLRTEFDEDDETRLRDVD